MMDKALSPLVSVVILVVISISIASFIAPWMYELVATTANETGASTEQQIRCRSAGLDFSEYYGYYGAEWNFSGGNGSDVLKVRVLNTGNIDLWGFSFEVTLSSAASGDEIRRYDPTSGTQMTASGPLRPYESSIIEANISEDLNDSVYSLKEVKVLNSVCRQVAPSLQV
jgi:hypothetical protein